jgi:hypothetical protein
MINNKLIMVIDSKHYKVNVLFNNAATENINDKILRLIRNEVENGVSGDYAGNTDLTPKPEERRVMAY